MTRSDRRLRKLTGNKPTGIKGRSETSIAIYASIVAELEFYWFKGGKTKSVRNRVARLEKAIDHFEGHLIMRANNEGIYACGCSNLTNPK